MSESARKLPESIGELASFVLTPPKNPKQRRHPTIFGPPPKAVISEARKKWLRNQACGMVRTWRRTKRGHKLGDKDLAVFEFLLFFCHRQENEQVFPSLNFIHEHTGIARSTIELSIKRLEATEMLRHVRRLQVVANKAVDRHGRPLNPKIPVRVSNAYAFGNPGPAPKTENRSGKRSSQIPPSKANPEKPKSTPQQREMAPIPAGVAAASTRKTKFAELERAKQEQSEQALMDRVAYWQSLGAAKNERIAAMMAKELGNEPPK